MILGIQTATDAAAIALVRDGRVLAEALRDVGTDHSEASFALLEAVLASSGEPKGAIVAVGVAIGPGGFTGVRTGMAMAKTIAAVRGLPVYGLDTLAALALQFAGPGVVAPMLDARRGLVFAGAYGADGGLLRAGALHALDAWLLELAALPGPVTAVGEGAMRHREAIAAVRPDLWIPPDGFMALRAAPVALAAERRWRAGEPSDGQALVPLYLREPQAVINWEAAQEKAP